MPDSRVTSRHRGGEPADACSAAKSRTPPTPVSRISGRPSPSRSAMASPIAWRGAPRPVSVARTKRGPVVSRPRFTYTTMPCPRAVPAGASGHASPSTNSRSRSPSASTSHTPTPPPMVSGSKRRPSAPSVRRKSMPQASVTSSKGNAAVAWARAGAGPATEAGSTGAGAPGRMAQRHANTVNATEPATPTDTQNARAIGRPSSAVGWRSPGPSASLGPFAPAVTEHPAPCRSEAPARPGAAGRRPPRARPHGPPPGSRHAPP